MPTTEEETVSYGEGLAIFIRNLARFSLGIITGYTAIMSAQLQMLPKDDRVIVVDSVQNFEIEGNLISVPKCQIFSSYYINNVLYMWNRSTGKCRPYWPRRIRKLGCPSSQKSNLKNIGQSKKGYLNLIRPV